MSPDTLLGAVPLLALAAASGLNVYATVAVLGFGSRLGLLDALPPELRGLEHGIVLGAAAVFLVVEAVAERVPFVDCIWSGIHTVVKPLAAALLTVAVLEPDGTLEGAGVVAAAAVVATLVHAGRGVVRASVDRSRRPVRELALHVLQAAAAAALVATYATQPYVALAVLAGVVAWTVVVGPRSWRLFVLTLHAQVGRVRALLGRSPWSEAWGLPADLRALVPPTPLAGAPPRVVPAGVKGVPGVGAYRKGWLLVRPDGAEFVYRSLLGRRRVALPQPRSLRIIPGAWLDEVEITGDGDGPCTVFLMKDGPDPEVCVADIRPR